MPTRKLADLPMPCPDHRHNPPRHQVFPPGMYEHRCPACGSVQHFTVNRVTL